MLVGELSSIQKASLPAFAALGRMLVPALIYLVLNIGGLAVMAGVFLWPLILLFPWDAS